MARLATPTQWGRYRSALRLGAVIGALFGATAGGVLLQPPLAGALFGGFTGILDLLAGMALIGGAEIFLPRTRLGRAIARLPFGAEVALKAAAYLAVAAAVVGGRFGVQVASLLAPADLTALFRAQMESAFPRKLVVLFGGLVTVLLVMLGQASKVIGDQTLRNLVLGRYRSPRREERFFLFIDVVGSTPVAERLGPLHAHRYLDRVFDIASDPIDDARGDVYQYVGDEIVVTWTLDEGRALARPLDCFFGVERALAAAAADFEREFGTVPRLRAALHAGEVVTGETGGSRRAIVFHGDVLNTTSRIENATRDLQRPFLVSEDALRRMDSVERHGLEDLGPRALRGREAPIRLYAVTARSSSGPVFPSDRP